MAKILRELRSIRTRDGVQLRLENDGKLWKLHRMFGGILYGPVDSEEASRVLIGRKTWDTVEPRALRLPSIEWKVPADCIAKWWQLLASNFPGESLIVYGYKADNKTWQAYLPKQEVSAASVDVNNFEPTYAAMRRDGYEPVGTLHIHPAGMTSCSGTDTGDIWSKFPGLHIIVERGGKIGYYWSIRKHTIRLHCDWVNPESVADIKASDSAGIFFTEGLKKEELVKEKTFTTTYKNNALFDKDDYEYDYSDSYYSNNKRIAETDIPYMGEYQYANGIWHTVYVRQMLGQRVTAEYADAFPCITRNGKFYADYDGWTTPYSRINSIQSSSVTVWIERTGLVRKTYGLVTGVSETVIQHLTDKALNSITNRNNGHTGVNNHLKTENKYYVKTQIDICVDAVNLLGRMTKKNTKKLEKLIKNFVKV